MESAVWTGMGMTVKFESPAIPGGPEIRAKPTTGAPRRGCRPRGSRKPLGPLAIRRYHRVVSYLAAARAVGLRLGLGLALACGCAHAPADPTGAPPASSPSRVLGSE